MAFGILWAFEGFATSIKRMICPPAPSIAPHSRSTCLLGAQGAQGQEPLHGGELRQRAGAVVHQVLGLGRQGDGATKSRARWNGCERANGWNGCTKI